MHALALVSERHSRAYARLLRHGWRANRPYRLTSVGGSPWGYSAHSALRWAYAQLASAGDTPSLLGGLRTGSKPERELERLELRGQAALIRGHVERLVEGPARAYLIAFYLPKPTLERPEAVRKSKGVRRMLVDHFPRERAEAIKVLGMWMVAQRGTGVHKVRAFQEVAAQYFFRQGESLDRIRDFLGVRRGDVPAFRNECYTLLRDLDVRAHALADNALFEAGILEYA